MAAPGKNTAVLDSVTAPLRKYLDDAVLPRWILGSHQILGSRHIPADFSEVAFRTVNMTNGKWARYYVLCQICQKPKAILAFTRWWACQRCHQLLHLSQVMDPVARRHAEYLEIQSRLKAGRQKGEQPDQGQAELVTVHRGRITRCGRVQSPRLDRRVST